MTHVFVVSRDHPVLFRHLRSHFADQPAVSVILDRRHEERRRTRVPVAIQRRRGERRAVPAGTWTSLGFVVVPSVLSPSARA
jgi:hypothetical protein